MAKRIPVVVSADGKDFVSLPNGDTLEGVDPVGDATSSVAGKVKISDRFNFITNGGTPDASTALSQLGASNLHDVSFLYRSVIRKAGVDPKTSWNTVYYKITGSERSSSFYVAGGGTVKVDNYDRSIAIGPGAYSEGSDAVSIGVDAQATGDGIALGNLAISKGIAFGHGSNAPYRNSIVLGHDMTATSDNQLMLSTVRISGVLPGTAGTDAINLDQLEDRTRGIKVTGRVAGKSNLVTVTNTKLHSTALGDLSMVTEDAQLALPKMAKYEGLVSTTGTLVQDFLSSSVSYTTLGDTVVISTYNGTRTPNSILWATKDFKTFQDVTPPGAPSTGKLYITKSNPEFRAVVVIDNKGTVRATRDLVSWEDIYVGSNKAADPSTSTMMYSVGVGDGTFCRNEALGPNIKSLYVGQDLKRRVINGFSTADRSCIGIGSIGSVVYAFTYSKVYGVDLDTDTMVINKDIPMSQFFDPNTTNLTATSIAQSGNVFYIGMRGGTSGSYVRRLCATSDFETYELCEVVHNNPVGPENYNHTVRSDGICFGVEYTDRSSGEKYSLLRLSSEPVTGTIPKDPRVEVIHFYGAQGTYRKNINVISNIGIYKMEFFEYTGKPVELSVKRIYPGTSISGVSEARRLDEAVNLQQLMDATQESNELGLHITNSKGMRVTEKVENKFADSIAIGSGSKVSYDKQMALPTFGYRVTKITAPTGGWSRIGYLGDINGVLCVFQVDTSSATTKPRTYYTTTDGVTFVERVLPSYARSYGLSQNGGVARFLGRLYIVTSQNVNTDRAVLSTADGVSWRLETTPFGKISQLYATSKEMYALIGNDYYKTRDGVYWERIGWLPQKSPRVIRVVNDRIFIFYTSSGEENPTVIISNPEGLYENSHISTPFPIGTVYPGVTHCGVTTLVSKNDSMPFTILRSKDLVTWETAEYPGSVYMDNSIYGPAASIQFSGRAVIIPRAYAKDAIHTYDGVTWERIPTTELSGLDRAFDALVFNGRLYVVSYDNTSVSIIDLDETTISNTGYAVNYGDAVPLGQAKQMASDTLSKAVHSSSIETSREIDRRDMSGEIGSVLPIPETTSRSIGYKTDGASIGMTAGTWEVISKSPGLQLAGIGVLYINNYKRIE